MKSAKILVPLAISRKEPGSSSRAYSPLHFARESYLGRLVSHGMVPLIVSSVMSESGIDQLYELANGVLFMGGEDVDASRYAEVNHPANEPDPERDRLEFYIMRKVLQQRLPFLGICRGAQVLAVASGGSLVQHVPDLGLTERHGNGVDVSEHAKDPTHEVLIEPGSKSHILLGIESATVNSSHHQSVKSLGKDMRVAARSPQGVVEIIEHSDPSFFCFGVQCHPERMESHPFDKFFDALKRAALNS